MPRVTCTALGIFALQLLCNQFLSAIHFILSFSANNGSSAAGLNIIEVTYEVADTQ